MPQLMFRFAAREAFLDACPAAWRGEAPDPVPPPELAALIVLGTLWDTPGGPDAPPVARPGYHVLGLCLGEMPAAFVAAEIPSQPGDPVIPSEDPEPVLPPEETPLEITRAQARIVMAEHILSDGRSLLTATREMLAAQLDATSSLPDADPQRIAAIQASEWWTAAATYRCDHPVLLAVAAALGITEAGIAMLFRSAAQITA
jgi:hypothetical protein